MSEVKKLSPVEGFKEQSDYLRGEIASELVDDSDFFGKGSIQLLKHHGTYQQDDRDIRKAARASGKKDKDFSFMVRVKMPGGKLTSQQFLTQLDLCDQLGNNTLRLTSRQGIQFHGVIKQNLKQVIQMIDQAQLTTLGACGDVQRNVMCCPAPYKSDIYQQVQQLADQIAEHFTPRTSAYHEIWLTDPANDQKELVAGGAQRHEIEPIYGASYLPRKFKIGVGFPHDNCIDLYTHDLALMAIVRDQRIIGYNMLAGGGQGVTPSAKKTFPALAKKMAFVTPDQAIAVATAVVKVQRDFGNREDRKVARLKYLIHDWGIDRFRAKVEEYYGDRLADPQSEDVHGFNDHMGWEEQGDGQVFYGLNIENGRVLDNDKTQLKSALREICTRYQPGIRLTSHQSMLLTDISPGDKPDIEAILQKHHVKLTEQISTVRRWSMACVAWPTCGLSITESERALPGLLDQLEVELSKLGLSNEKFTVRMTGCPNGCARPYNSDIGLVGKAVGKYTIFLGGRLLGDRLNFIYKDQVPESEVVSQLAVIFAFFKESRETDETFGDFCHRQGKEALLSWSDKFAS